MDSIHLHKAVDDPPEFFGAADDSEAEFRAEHGIADVIREGGDNRLFTDTRHPLRCPPEACGEVLKGFVVSSHDVVQVARGQGRQDLAGEGLRRSVALHPVDKATALYPE